MKCILIDDEVDCLELLAILIRKYCPELEIIGMYDNPRRAIDAVWEIHPDLVFLDVDMPEMNGFEVLDACRKLHFQVIFTTAYHEYAVKAFKYSATGYLLKPVDRSELFEAVQKARHMLSVQQIAEQREIMFSYLNPGKPGREKIALPTADGLVFLPVAEIVYCQAAGNYTEIYSTHHEKAMLFVKPLKEIEELLQGSDFFRTHHSYLINLHQVWQYIKGEGGELKMSNGKLVPIARSKKQSLLERLTQI